MGRHYVPQPVKTATLNLFVTENEINKIDLIKMDTKGTDHIILEQRTEYLVR